MFDTVKLALPVADSKRVVDRLAEVKECYAPKTGAASIVGMVGNLRARLSAGQRTREHLLVVEGSLPTYHGHLALDVAETYACMERLSDALGLDLRPAKVLRLDVFADFVLSRPVADYLLHLLDGPRYQRVSYDQVGKRYELKWRHLVFYDKVAELKRKRGLVPEAWVGKYVLRYEMQMRRRPNRQLALDRITFADLADESFCSHAADRWQTEYHRISKRRDYVGGVSAETFKVDLQCAGLRVVGLDAVETILTSAFDQGTIPEWKYYRLRRWARDTYNLDARTALASPVEEL
ncbi:MAG: hypothetical protein AAFX41_06185, partial [Bacteroidota bacterium]